MFLILAAKSSAELYCSDFEVAGTLPVCGRVKIV